MHFEILLKNLLSENSDVLGKEDLLDILHSKRSREKLNQMLSIVERMDLGHVVDQQQYDVVSSDNEILRELGKAVSCLADGRMRLSLCDLSWHPSICYPLPRDSIGDKLCLQAPWDILSHRLSWAVVSGRWNVDVKDTRDVTETLDVVSLLSLGGTLVDPTGEQIVLEPDTFKNNYVMVFCIDAPAIFGTDITCQGLLNLCNEMSSDRADVKMVMVARMNILADTKEVFDHLFSGFPTSCLAIPYEDWARRERVCKLLKCETLIRCSIYNTDGIFLTSFCADASVIPYGAEAFPFTGERLKEIDTEREQLQKDSLDKLLRPPYESSPDVAVYKLDDPQEQMSILEVIKNKHVGLYVCCGGDFIPSLQKLFLQSRERGEKFEIVVIYLPLLCQIDPDIFKEKIESMLKKGKISGWCLPFNNSVSLRLWGLTMDLDWGFEGDEKWQDKMIIVGPDGKILDMYGSMVIDRYCAFDAYPFTREAVVKKKIKQVKEVRLESLLEGELLRGDNLSDTISAESLLNSGKRIIIFMGHPLMHVVGGSNYAFDSQGFVSEYERMKVLGDEFEVVFIEYPRKHEFIRWKFVTEAEAGKGGGEEKARDRIAMPLYIHPRYYEFGAMPWYIHRGYEEEEAFTPLAEKLKELVGHESLIGFGEDGCICSIKLLYRKPEARPCLQDTLEKDVYVLLDM